MKKLLTSIIVIVLVLTCALTLLTACDEPTDYEHTIVFYSNQGSALRGITAEVIAEFEAKYPGWHVEHDYSAGSWEGLPNLIVKDIRNGNQPDLAYCYPDHVATYLTNRTVVDLNKYFASEETFNVQTYDKSGNKLDTTIPTRLGYDDEERDDFSSIYMADGRADNFTDVTQFGYANNALLALPFIKSTELLFYNKDALQALVSMMKAKSDSRVSLFVDGDNIVAPASWDILWAQCAVIKEYYPNVTPFTYDSEANWFITMCAQNGWKYTDKNADEHFPFRNQQGLEEWLMKLYGHYKNDAYFLTRLTLDSSGGSYTSDVFSKGVGKVGDVTVDAGEGGGAIYCIGSSGGATYQDSVNFSVGIAPIPGTDDGEGHITNKAIAQGPSFVMFRGGHGVTNADEKEKMTWLFMKMMLEPKWQVKFCGNNGYIPSRESAYDVIADVDRDGNQITFGEKLEAKQTTIAYAAYVAHQMQLSGVFFTSPAFDGSSTARQCVESLMIKVLGGSGASIGGVKAAIQQTYDDCGGLN